MNIHKLHIFAKNRDAVAAQKGYTFQQLKTLEDWIENRINGGQEEIYCDYEDDILSRDVSQSKTKFTQIKLYATDFSFSTDGIKKAIAHFFSLYVKGEYSFDEVEFFFETNASVVSTDVKGNDADLLREWSQNQDNISEELLTRIRTRVKIILKEYTEDRTKEIEKNVNLKSDLQIAKNVFDQLSDDDYNSFINCIKWKFEGVDSNSAMASTLSKINELIPKIPLPLDAGKTVTYSSILVNEVWQRSSKDEPEDRKLTNDLLDSILLAAGEKEDKLYVETYALYKGVSKINQFFPGEFQTVVNGARYCRWQQLDENHRKIWLNLLKQYIELDDTAIPQKRKAIYEYAFLKIGNDQESKMTESPLIGNKELIKFYFENWEQRHRLQDIETDITLLQLIKGQINLYNLSIPTAEVDKWEEWISAHLKSSLETETNIDRTCELLELQGHLAYQIRGSDKSESCKMALNYYRQIPPLLEKAHYYSLANLYGQLTELIKVLTKLGDNDELVEMIDEFTGEIQEYAEKTGLAHKSAQDLIERAKLHLDKRDFINYLKAIELFHRAKAFWRTDLLMEPYIICLQGISEVYKALGMTYAAKYYALLAFWCTWQSADPRMYKHLQNAFTLIQQLDFQHGAWINAIQAFKYYIFAKREFDEKGFETEYDPEFVRATLEMAIVIHSTSLIVKGSEKLTTEIKLRLGFIWTDMIKPLVAQLETELDDLVKLEQVLSSKLIDAPFGDLGSERNIHFNALDNNWTISFKNNEVMSFIGEEFTSFLQVSLCELAKKHTSLFITGKEVNITIETGHFQRELVSEHSWLINIPEFDGKDQSTVQKHYMYVGAIVKALLQDLSTLQKKEFDKFYIEQLLQKDKLGEKVLEAAAYQRIIRHTIGTSVDDFFSDRNWDSAKIDLDLQSPKWLI